MTFKFRLFLILVAVVTLSAALHLRNQLETTRAFLEEQLAQSAQDAAHHVGMWLQEPLGQNDMVLVETRLNAFFDSGYYQSVRLQRLDGTTLYERLATTELDDTPAWLLRLFPLAAPERSSEISDGWRRVAVISVRSNTGIAAAYLWQATQETASTITLVAFFALLLGLLLLGRVLRPLKEIEHQADAICRREFPQIPEKPRPREFAKVVEALNRMALTVQRNFTSLSQQAERFREEAYLDAETGLGNRRAFEAALDRELADDQSPNGSVVLVNLSGLEKWRTEQGGAAVVGGVRQIAERILQTARLHGCQSYRPSMSEFALLMEATEEEGVLSIARDLAARCAAISEYALIRVAATDYLTGETRGAVMSRLDSALRRVTEEGGIRMERTTSSATAVVSAQDRREQVLTILRSDALLLQAQPIVQPQSRVVLMHEVLLRVRDTGSGLSLVDLLSEVRRFGLADELDRRVLSMTLEALPRLPADSRLSVNLMPASLADPEFMSWLDLTLTKVPAAARRLVFEIPETAIARSAPLVAELAHLAARHQADLTIEHVGVAAAPFIYLRDLKPQQIKIDGRYLRAIPDAREKWQFIRALVQMGHGLGIAVYAEQVESEAELAELTNLGVDGVQGYAVERPKRIEEIVS